MFPEVCPGTIVRRVQGCTKKRGSSTSQSNVLKPKDARARSRIPQEHTKQSVGKTTIERAAITLSMTHARANAILVAFTTYVHTRAGFVTLPRASAHALCATRAFVYSPNAATCFCFASLSTINGAHLSASSSHIFHLAL